MVEDGGIPIPDWEGMSLLGHGDVTGIETSILIYLRV